MTKLQIDKTMAICFVILIASLFTAKGEALRMVLDIILFIGWSVCCYHNPIRLTPFKEMDTVMDKLNKVAIHVLPVMGAVGAITSAMAWW